MTTPIQNMTTPIQHKLNAIPFNIRARRVLKNYTQVYLSQQLNISQNAYSKIELGLTKLTLSKLFAIADILETDPIEFLDEKKYA